MVCYLNFSLFYNKKTSFFPSFLPLNFPFSPCATISLLFFLFQSLLSKLRVNGTTFKPSNFGLLQTNRACSHKSIPYANLLINGNFGGEEIYQEWLSNTTVKLVMPHEFHWVPVIWEQWIWKHCFLNSVLKEQASSCGLCETLSNTDRRCMEWRMERPRASGSHLLWYYICYLEPPDASSFFFRSLVIIVLLCCRFFRGFLLHSRQMWKHSIT